MRILNGPDKPVCALGWTPDGRQLVAGMYDGMIAIWDTLLGEPKTIVRLVAKNKFPLRIAISPDGRTLAAGSHHLVLAFWNLEEGRFVAPISDTVRASLGFAFAPDGKTFVVAPRPIGSQAPFLRRWSLETRREVLPHFPSPELTPALPVFAPDGSALALAATDRTVRLLDPTTGAETVRWRVPSAVSELAWLLDSETLVTMLHRSIVFWDTRRKKVRARLKPHPRRINTIAVAPDGGTLLTGCDDGLVRLWDTETLVCRATFDWGIGKISAVAYSPEGLTAAAAGERGALAVWDVDELRS